MTTPPTVTAFLLARYDEDEAAAKAATPGPWLVSGDDGVSTSEDVRSGDGDFYNLGPGIMHSSFEDNGSANAAHIARHDPAHVLADIASKRAIVKRYAHLAERGDSGDARWVLPWLASVYAYHADYQQEWTP